MCRWGNAVALTSTVNTYFGSLVISPSTGNHPSIFTFLHFTSLRHFTSLHFTSWHYFFTNFQTVFLPVFMYMLCMYMCMYMCVQVFCSTTRWTTSLCQTPPTSSTSHLTSTTTPKYTYLPTHIHIHTHTYMHTHFEVNCIFLFMSV